MNFKQYSQKFPSILIRSLLICGTVLVAQNYSMAESECNLNPGKYTFLHPGASQFTKDLVYKTEVEVLSVDHFILKTNWGVDATYEFNFLTGKYRYGRSWMPEWMLVSENCTQYPFICSESARDRIIPILNQAINHFLTEDDLLPVYIREMDSAERIELYQGRCLLKKLEKAVATWNREHELRLQNHYYRK